MSNDVLTTGSTAGAFHFGEFVFDSRLRQLLRGGQPQQLSPKAQQLLLLLLHARPRALAREELYDALWPTTFVCETNLASVVNELRRALGDHARAPLYIRTVHGFGYAFCGDVAASASGRAPAGTLVCYGQKHQLYAGENSVGRGDDCQIVVPDPTVSRCHAMITIDGGVIRIRDLGSKNGTYVDGQRIGSMAVPVKSHNCIELGAVSVSIVSRRVLSTKKLHLNMPEVTRESAARLATA